MPDDIRRPMALETHEAEVCGDNEYAAYLPVPSDTPLPIPFYPEDAPEVARLVTEIEGLRWWEYQLETCNRPIDAAAFAEWSRRNVLFQNPGPMPRWQLSDLTSAICRQRIERENELALLVRTPWPFDVIRQRRVA